ncbi:hypothetical protein H4R20_001334 [Coemansia guatemalensis]|uniref:Extracellular membrane protein CFEM domain-containing protein n=1 Tax=Coemansia guatemalensis TaxID=2761395 RepID=A0A9W8HXL0_9FUNG|nr:hypothetical protein H4R20_001334 [Coemansia guatemalensis]
MFYQFAAIGLLFTSTPVYSASTSNAPAGCALSEQVKLCVNHSSMQRATCNSDDLDCQCTWASRMTTCYAPCIAEKEFSDGMHVAHGTQDSICSQAAKYGQIAKDKEKQRLEEKNNKGKKKLDVPTTQPKDINDLNSALESASPSLAATGVEKHSESNIPSDTKPADTRAASNPVPHKPAGAASGGKHGAAQSKAGTHASGKARKGVPGGDSEAMADSSASASAANMLLLGLCSIGLAGITTDMIPFF